MRLTAILFSLVTAFLMAIPSVYAEPKCELERSVNFAGLDWDSALFHSEVAAFILQKGLGCQTEIIPGTTIPLTAGLVRGDLDIMMEIWNNQTTEAWRKGEEAGKVQLLGFNFPDAVQGWFIPRYLVEGANAPAKGLTHVQDLVKFKTLFRDPEAPKKGRFYNCKLGWNCETINTKKFQIYGLGKHFVNFRSGTGAALSAAIASAYKRKKPIVYYYWGPSWIMGKYDAVKLKEPDCSEEEWKTLTSEKSPTKACAYPINKVYIGANTTFIQKAPVITAFLRKYKTSSKLVNEALVYLKDNKGARARDAALFFLKTHPEIWTKWLPEDVAKRVKAAL